LKPGKFIVTGSSGQASSIKIWDTVNGVCLKAINGHDDSITSIKKIDPVTIASSSFDKTIKIWNW